MAWPNSLNMGPGSGGSAAGSSDAGGSGGQPQGTEYTLQGKHATAHSPIMEMAYSSGRPLSVKDRADNRMHRRNAILTDRMAQTRTGTKRMADRKSGDESQDREVGR